MDWPLINSLVRGLKRVPLIKMVSGHISLDKILQVLPPPPYGFITTPGEELFSGRGYF